MPNGPTGVSAGDRMPVLGRYDVRMIPSGNGPKRACMRAVFDRTGIRPGFASADGQTETVRSGNGPYIAWAFYGRDDCPRVAQTPQSGVGPDRKIGPLVRASTKRCSHRKRIPAGLRCGLSARARDDGQNVIPARLRKLIHFWTVIGRTGVCICGRAGDPTPFRSVGERTIQRGCRSTSHLPRYRVRRPSCGPCKLQIDR